MAFYYSSTFSDENGYDIQVPYDSRYYESCYYPPFQSSACFSSYEYVPARSLVAYSACHENYSNPVSTQFVTYHSVTQTDDLDFEEYDPRPFSGGYDIVQTYGKPLPPSDQICHPRSSLDPGSQTQTQSPNNLPHEEETEDLKSESQVTEEQEVEEEEEDVATEEQEDQSGDSDGLDEEIADSVQVYEGVGMYNPPLVDQMPPGSGLEAFDLCENLFGHWPCLSRMKKNCPSCGNEIGVRGGDDADKWKRTVDYLFGSPDPYRGWADQGGYASGNPVHVYQMRYQQPPALYEQADLYGQNSWLL